MEKLENRKLKEDEVVQLLKAKHLQTAQTGTGDSSVDVSNYCEWNFRAAKVIVSKLQSDHIISEIVFRHEAMKGSESCFNSLVKLEKFAQRPSCLASRRFVFQLLDDQLCHGLVKHDQVSKNDVVGSSTNPGLIHLYEFKWRALTYVLDIMAVQAKMKDEDRVVSKHRLSDPASTRSNTQDNVGWQGSLAKSSLEALTFVHELVFLKKYDNVLRPAIKPNSHPEILAEMDTVQEAWSQVVATRENELAEEKAALQAVGEKSDELKMARQTPNTLPENSPAYWRSVANQTVRMYADIGLEGNSSATVVRCGLDSLFTCGVWAWSPS